MTLNRITSLSMGAGLMLVSIAACGSDANSLFGGGEAGTTSTGAAATTSTGSGTTGGGTGTGNTTTSVGTTGGSAGDAGAAGGTGGAMGGAAGKSTGGAGGTSGGAGGTTATTGSGGTAGSGTGGTAGGSVDAGNPCANLEADYRAALIEAKTCNPRAAALQCQTLVNTSVSCPGCTTHVENAAQLQEIEKKWVASGCKRGICPAIACINPGFGVCSESGGSGGRCIDSPVLR